MANYLIEDTRQQIGKHKWKRDYWKEHGIGVTRCALPVGDYMLSPDVVCDSKRSLAEVTINLVSGSASERKRFINEESLAAEMGTKLIFVIEQDGIESKEDLIPLQIVTPNGVIVKGSQLMAAMDIHEHKYGTEFIFCKPSEAGKVVLEQLKRSVLYKKEE